MAASISFTAVEPSVPSAAPRGTVLGVVSVKNEQGIQPAPDLQDQRDDVTAKLDPDPRANRLDGTAQHDCPAPILSQMAANF